MVSDESVTRPIIFTRTSTVRYSDEANFRSHQRGRHAAAYFISLSGHSCSAAPTQAHIPHQSPYSIKKKTSFQTEYVHTPDLCCTGL